MSGPLRSGTTVIDLSRALAGPHAGMMLDMGARVIKVETPGTPGDDTRGWGPPFVGEDDDLDLLPLVQPQQGVGHPRPEVRRRRRR